MKKFCILRHNTEEVGRSSAGRCRACKRLSERKPAVTRPSTSLPVEKGAFLTLTFDIENRPLSYWIPDQPTAEITAIAWSFDNPKAIECVLLGRDDPREMLTRFVEAYDRADMVTGHYITRHDLPIINGALMEFGLPMLRPKLALDTKVHMVKKSDIPATQEHLANMLSVPAAKVHMTQADWRESNRLTPAGLALTERRVKGDVRQHMLLRPAMQAAGLLKSPRTWRS